MPRKLVCLAVLLLGICLAAPDRFQYIPLKKDKNYPLKLSVNKNNSALTDILVDLPEQNELRELGAYADVYAEHPHPAEYHGGSLYLLKKKKTYNGDLTELWQYRGEKSALVYAAYDYLTFRVSPDDKYIAIFADKKLSLMSAAGEKKRALYQEDLYPKNAPAKARYNLQPASWNSAEFWFVLKNSQNRVERMFFISALNWKYMAYDDLPFKPVEYAISPRGSIAYSDYGLRKNIFTLYTYNPRTKKAETVATSNYNFAPEWRDDTKLDFNSPANGKTRVTKFE